MRTGTSSSNSQHSLIRPPGAQREQHRPDLHRHHRAIGHDLRLQGQDLDRFRAERRQRLRSGDRPLAQDDCKVFFYPLMVSLSNHRWLVWASFDKLRMSRNR